MSRAVSPETATVTTGAFALSRTLLDSEQIISLCLAINTAPTSAGSITITLDSNAGAAYDTVLATVDPVATSMTSWYWYPESTQRFVAGDAISVAYANPDNRTVSGSLYYDLNPNA